MDISFTTVSSLVDENGISLVRCDACGSIIRRDDWYLHDEFHTRVEPG